MHCIRVFICPNKNPSWGFVRRGLLRRLCFFVRIGSKRLRTLLHAMNEPLARAQDEHRLSAPARRWGGVTSHIPCTSTTGVLDRRSGVGCLGHGGFRQRENPLHTRMHAAVIRVITLGKATGTTGVFADFVHRFPQVTNVTRKTTVQVIPLHCS